MQTLQKFWQKWLGLSRAAGNLLGHILLTIFYFTLMLPFSLGMTLFGDPLQLKGRQGQYWRDRDQSSEELDAARRQF